ncbi:MAG: agmatinase [Candidatus Delongbacteria bacterium]|nr:agmatinase [Candidatus Delongbacteria bacterium]
MRTFGDTEDKYAGFERGEILLQPVPYDGTSSWGKGADKGFEAFLEAAGNMETYDIETDSEVYKRGIHILDPITEKASPEKMTEAVYERTKELLETGKFLTFFGGEHSISIGVIRAFAEKYPGITILHFDAHADLRSDYCGSTCNHACAVHEASKTANLVQIGIRSMDISEKQFLNTEKCFLAHQILSDHDWMDKALSKISDKVYITFDLDALDPSIMPSTGTPEPGGLFWDETLRFLSNVFAQRTVLGFDIVELAPIEHLKHPDMLTAKLYYKMLSYKFMRRK